MNLYHIFEGYPKEGITSPGGSDNNDSTSPIHGYGESKKRKQEPEVEYDDEYQALVARVGQKAKEQEKRKPVDIEKLAQRLRNVQTQIKETIRKIDAGYRLYSHTGKNLGTYPTKAGAEKRERQVQYFKHANEDSQPMSQASRELLRVARQSNPEAIDNTDAIYAYLSNIAKKTQENYKKVNDILRQLDPLSTELDSTERELHDVEKVNQQQQDLLNRLSKRVDQVRKQELPSQKRASDVQAQKAADKAEKEREIIIKNLDKEQEPATHQPQQVVQPQGDIADTKARQDIETVAKHIRDLEQRMYAKDTTDKAKSGIIRDLNKMKSTLGGANPDKIRDLARSLDIDKSNQKELPFDESLYESRLYAMRRAGYDIL